MDPSLNKIQRNEVRKAARQVVTDLIKAMYRYDPVSRRLHARYTVITEEVLVRMIDKAIDEEEPITAREMHNQVISALSTPLPPRPVCSGTTHYEGCPHPDPFHF